MTVEHVDTSEAFNNVRHLLENDKNIFPGLKAAIEVLIFLVTTLVNRLNLNSRNSSKPPSSDFGANTPEKNNNSSDDNNQDNSKEKRKPGGQTGHRGHTLNPVTEPDEVITIAIDRRSLPRGECYQEAGVETRQVFSLRIQRFVSEYQAEVLVDGQGNHFVAPFPNDVTPPTQYGAELKGHAVYLSQFQLLPYDRMASYFKELLQMPISQGSIYNFNLQAY